MVMTDGTPDDDNDSHRRPSIIGLMADDADLLDEIVEEAMRDRETRPWRTEEA